MKILSSVYLLLWLYVTSTGSVEIDFEFTVVNNSGRITQVVHRKADWNYKDCIKLCAIIESCRSINYERFRRLCELSDSNRMLNGTIKVSQRWSYIEKIRFGKDSLETLKSTNACPGNLSDKKRIVKSIEFTRKSSYSMSFPVNLNYGYLPHLTICFWFISNATRKEFIFSFSSLGKCSLFNLRLIGKNNLKFKLAPEEQLIAKHLTRGIPYHVCVKFSSVTGASIYLNGQNSLSNDAEKGKKFNFDKLYLGQNIEGPGCQRSNEDHAFVGHIASFYIWQKDLTQKEIQEVFNHIVPDEQKAYWENSIYGIFRTNNQPVKQSYLSLPWQGIC